jgi:gliding motility-associated-like protein
MKRPITTFVIGLALLVAAQLAAMPTFTVSPTTITANQGDNITVEIKVSNFTNILSFQYSMNWNPAVLQFQSVGNFTSQLPSFGASNLGTNQGNVSTGKMTASWLDPDVAGVSVPNGTVLYTVTFTVLSTTGTTIAFTDTPTVIEVIDGNGNNVGMIKQDATVNGGGGNPPPNTTDLIVKAPTTTAAAGASICLDISVQNFTNILSMQYSMNFDASVLQFTGIQGLNLKDLSNANFGTNQAGSGKLTLSWLDQDATGVTVANGTVIYKVCFTVIGSSGQSSNFSFTGNPTAIEVINGNNANVPFSPTNGSVTVDGGTPPPPQIQGFAIIATNETVPTGTPFCVDIKVNDFIDIVSMQYTMEFDKSKVQFTGIQGLNLPGLAQANFGTNQAGNGILTLSWLDPDVAGVTLQNGTVIYQVCFNAIGPNSCNTSSQFKFSSSATSIEVTDKNGNVVPWQGIPGNITICDTPPQGGLEIFASKETAPSGTQACVDVMVKGFTNVVSAQYSMHFTNTIIKYASVQNFGLPDLVASSFNATPGTIAFSWFDNTTNGVTLADSTVIYSVCFDVIGTTGQVSDFTFDGTPTSIEITNVNNQAIQATFTPGSVTVGTNCAGPINITNATTTNVACNGDSNGAVDISVNGGSGTYAYTWKNAGGTTVSTNQDLTGAAAGTYTLTVSSCGGQQTKTATYTISQPGSKLNATEQVTNVACNGQFTGAIVLSPTGGTVNPPACTYKYKWSNNATTKDINNLPAGAYSVTVTDCNGCQFISDPINVAQAPTPFVSTVSAVPVKCFGTSSGAIIVTASGGVGPYQYRLPSTPPHQTFQSSNTFGNLPAGNYTVEARDAFGCVKSSTATITTPMDLSANATPALADNGCNGSITLTITGGTPGGPAPGYTINWTGPGGFTSNQQNPKDLCPGNYSVTVTDFNGCSEVVSNVQVKAPLVVGSEKRNACFGLCDGTITLNVSGGLTPYTYNWTGGVPAVPNPKDLCPGSYTVTVTAADNQTMNLTVNISQAASAVQVTNQNIVDPTSSFNCDGSVTVTSVTGGFGQPFTYQWSNSQTGATANGLCDEVAYTVTVSDVNGCTGTKSFTPDFNPATLVPAAQATNTTCYNTTDGKLTIQTTGGVGPFDFTFSGPTAVSPILDDADGAVIVTGLAPGTYNVTVTDSAPGSDQQTKNFTATVSATPQLTIDPVLVYPATATQNGKIDINPKWLSPPYTYQWSNGFSGQNPSNLSPDCYDLTVGYNNNQCFQVFEDICVGLFDANGVVDKPNCPGDLGSVVLSVSNGNLPLTYTWKNAAGQVVDTDSILSGRPVGTYTVEIKDALGVIITKTFSLTSVSNLSATTEALSNFNGAQISCFGKADGRARVNPASGVSPFTYLWSDGSTTQTINNKPAGNYTVTVTDAEGCEFVSSISLKQPDQLLVDTQGDNLGCGGEGSGQATAIANGGTKPYSYLWSDPLKQQVPTAILLKGGIYKVTVTDVNGCTSIKDVFVPEIDSLTVFVVTEPDEGGPNGSATAIAKGGMEPYEYEWMGYLEKSNTLTELLPGTYFVKVTDANACEAFAFGKVVDGTQCLEFRSIITPEGDGWNEDFVIGCLSRYSDNRLEIYNRWGQIVYEATNYNDGDLWRGTNQRGDDVPDGVYYFVFEYIDPANNQKEVRKGTVVVLRK